MKKVSEFVQRVESHYVGDDCVQVMIPYNNELTVFNDKGIIFSHDTDSYININKYLEDERRKQFPYSNIPTHTEKVGLFKKVNYTNQIFDFEKPYVRVGDGMVVENFALKNNDEALIVNKLMCGEYKSIYLTRDEMDELYKSTNDKFILPIYGFDNIGEERLRVTDYRPITNEEIISQYVEEQMIKGVKDFREYMRTNPNSEVVYYLMTHPVFLDYVEESIKSMDLTKAKLNIALKGGVAIIVNNDKNDMKIELCEAHFVSLNKYRIDILDLPVNIYTLEQIKQLSTKIIKAKEPQISLRFNPGRTKHDLEVAKEAIKRLKKI